MVKIDSTIRTIGFCDQPRWLSGSVLRRWLGGLGFEAGSERDFKLLLQSSLSFYRSLGWRGGWMRGERN